MRMMMMMVIIISGVRCDDNDYNGGDIEEDVYVHKCLLFFAKEHHRSLQPDSPTTSHHKRNIESSGNRVSCRWLKSG